jgi:hypothetical protein
MREGSWGGAALTCAFAVALVACGDTSGTTGSACTASADCDGNPGTCLMTTVWKGGYCTSSCSVSHNHSTTALNPDCPSDRATCVVIATGSGNGTPQCVAACTAANECRSEYACFSAGRRRYVCLPRAFSECDPRVRGSCGAGETCVNVGFNDVGVCRMACNPIANSGCSNAEGCYASGLTGEGLCTTPCVGTNSAGASCTTGAGRICGGTFSDCPGGYGCLGNAGENYSPFRTGTCFKYCDKNTVAVQCSAGATCEPLRRANGDPSDPVNLTGICTSSN